MIGFTLERVTQPAIEPVTLAEAKIHLNELLSVTPKDDWIEELITGARQWAEDETGRALIDQTWQLNIGGRIEHFALPLQATVITGWSPYFNNGIYLHRSPVLDIISVATLDSDGAATAQDVSDYTLIEQGSKWPKLLGLSNGGNYRVVFRAGYADRTGSPTQGAEVVPNAFKTAIKLHVEAMYDRDEKMMNLLLTAAKNILMNERCNLQVA